MLEVELLKSINEKLGIIIDMISPICKEFINNEDEEDNDDIINLLKHFAKELGLEDHITIKKVEH